MSMNGFNVDPGASRRRLARSMPCAAKTVRLVTSTTTTTKAPGSFPMARSTSRCNFEAAGTSSERSGKARSIARENAIAIGDDFRLMGDAELNCNACWGAEAAPLPLRPESCRLRDSVYYLDRRRARKSARGDLSETKREIQFFRPEESAHVSQGSLLLRMELRSNPEMLCVVRNALGQLAATLGSSEPDCHAVVLAVVEALTNIIRHAYLGDLEKPIEASFRRIQVPRDGKSEDALEIVLEDSEETPDSKKLCARALEDVRPGGLGLHFIRQSMDTVEFSRRNGRNQLRLVKFLQVHAPRKDNPGEPNLQITAPRLAKSTIFTTSTDIEPASPPRLRKPSETGTH